MTTNELALSSDLPTLTAEINAYKRVAGEAIFEIGRRLKHVKERDLAHGQWELWCREKAGFEPSEARKFVRVVDELGVTDRCTYTELGLRALYEIATLPPEYREKALTVPSTGATKTVDEMTVRELREVKAALKAERERAEKAVSDYETVRDTLESMRDQPPQVEYVYVENAESDPLAVTGDVRINGNVQRLSEAVGEVLEEFGFFQYYDRQVQALGERSRDELTTVVTALERFTHSLKRALNASDADVIEI